MQLVNQLKTMLGTESADSWLVFMQAVEDQLPLLNQSGRPTKAQIEASEIGKSGFTSWAAMVESKSGLNWSYNSWKAWKKAWLQVKKHPYLINSGLTASEINTITRETAEFPASAEALKSHKSNRKEKQANAKAASLNELKKLLRESQEHTKILEIELATLRLQAGKKKTDFEAQLAANTTTICGLQEQLVIAKEAETTLLTVKQKGFIAKIRWAFSN
jgi:hypothetical protein